MNNQPTIELSPTLPAWRITRIEKIRGERNGNRHNAFIYILDANGNRIDASKRPRIDWTWIGRTTDQTAQEPQPKTHPDPYDYDIPLERGVYASIWVRGAASDKAHAVTAMLPDEDAWNTWGHHSWEIWFQWVESEEQKQPELSEAEQLLAEIQVRLIRLAALAG